MSNLSIDPREIRKAVTASRKAMNEGLDYLAVEQLVNAYSAFERAERYAFQAKDLVRNGGKFESEEIE